ncbi:HelD family protein [Deinococcus roseus]|uniref:DNA 3'-5' helicase n=1 Tax=Deinococcus roseus TaxID=392414 RepID=A0ABQ2DIE8_9DEIO|nr:UvrD-helicase domain-containing protein [Deinococcus roseus]GGJ58703.1 hypothetical protein GCM10008938_51030 [Deinococcus roseus]
MNPEEHPEYRQEKQTLRETALLIEQDIEAQRNGYMEGGGNLWTNRSINRNIREDTLKSLEDNQYKPYFARLEFLDSSGKKQNYYFGRTHIQLPHITVLSWQSPVYSLFIQGNSQKQSYHVPARNKTHQVQLLLKRRFELSLHDIHFIKDEADYRKGATRAPTNQDSFLIRKLQQRGNPGLQDIVETIQIDQDRIIRAPLNVSLVLHGVAGSGKTSVAFHRLAYLLFDETGHNLTPDDVLVLAPSRRFLHHVRDLLPALGVKGVQQITFFDWVFQQFNNDSGVEFNPEDYSLEDSHFEGFLEAQTSPHQQQVWQAATVKNSLKFLELIERYTQNLYARVQLPEDDVVLEEQLGVQKVKVTFKPQQVRKALSSAFEMHSGYTERRQQFLQNLQNHFLELHEQRFWTPRDHEDRRYIQAMSARINIHFGRLYRRFNLMAFYQELFEPRTLFQVDQGLLEIWELSALQQEPARKTRNKNPEDAGEKEQEERLQLDMTDVAPLYALYLSLKGKAEPTYRHIIIDEAQDFTPLQLALLRQHNTEGSFTIVGDTAQNIFAHRGLDDWSAIKEVMGPSAISEKITQNYRSTHEIVLFGNAVQQVVRGQHALKAVPVARHGQKPVLHQSDQLDLLLKSMLDTLHHLAHQGRKNIAVLTRDRKQAQNLSTWLSGQKVHHNLQLDNNPPAGTQTQDSILSVLPAAVSKGMEFEAVLVYDTSEDNYPVLNPLLGKLLFVAVSRALHELYLFSLGRPSGHLRATPGLCKHLHHPAPDAGLPAVKTPVATSPGSKPNPSFQKPRTHQVIRLKPHLTSYQGLQVTLQGSGQSLPTDDLLHFRRIREALQDLLGEDFVREMDSAVAKGHQHINTDLIRLLQLGITSLQSKKKPGTQRPQNVPEAVWQSWLHHFEEHRKQLLTPELRSLQFELYFNPG